MTQRTALILAAALTAFVLVLAGVMLGRSSLQASGQETAATPAENEAPTLAPADGNILLTPAELQAIQQREAEYNALVQQANNRLERAYAQINAAAPTAQTPAEAAQPYTVSAELAIEVAKAYFPKAFVLGAPTLIDYKGVPAWSVTLDLGLLYISATNGDLLYNGTLPPVYSSGGGGGASIGAGGGGGGEHGDDHDDDNGGEGEGGDD
ncbi:MAG: hypothetical protein ACKOC5_09945 [Chloroflexota bacterium]